MLLPSVFSKENLEVEAVAILFSISDKYVAFGYLNVTHMYSNGNTWFRQTTRILTKVSATELNTTHVQKNTYSDTTCTSLHNTDTYTYSSGKYNMVIR